MFICGALTIYLVSCIVAVLLDHFRIVDIWDFGEVYFNIPLVIIVFPFAFTKRLIRFRHDAVLLWKLGCKPFGKYEQFDDLNDETLDKIINGIQSTAIKLYCHQIIYRRKCSRENKEYGNDRNN